MCGFGQKQAWFLKASHLEQIFKPIINYMSIILSNFENNKMNQNTQIVLGNANVYGFNHRKRKTQYLKTILDFYNGVFVEHLISVFYLGKNNFDPRWIMTTLT